MKRFTLILSLLVAMVTTAMAQTTYIIGSRTTNLVAGKKYFISVSSDYYYDQGACVDLLYNDNGTITKSTTRPRSIESMDNAAYLFTVEEVGDGYLAYIKNSDGKYIQADNLASTETKTGLYVIPYFVGKAVCCGSDLDACDEYGNKIPYGSITAETPIVTVQKNADYTNAENRNGWRYIKSEGLTAGTNWATPFAFYEAVEMSETVIEEKRAELIAAFDAAQSLLETAEFEAEGGGEIALQVNDPTGAGYISCSNIDPTEGSDMNYLIDGKNNTYIHTNWHTVSASNDYLTVYLGEGNGISSFQFSEVTRSDAQNDFPKSIEILGSTNGDSYTNITTISGLPTNAGASYTSPVIECDPSYVYLRFVVTTDREKIFFHMAEFSLFEPLNITTNKEYKGKDKVLYALSLAVQEAEKVLESSSYPTLDGALAAINGYIAEATKVYPFTLTTDDENPALYAIKSGRGDAYWYTYDSEDGKIALSQLAGDDTQLWFFKEVATDDYKCALQLYPYADKTKAMSYQDTNNNPAKIVAQIPGELGWTNLWFLATTGGNAPYGLQTYNEANYLSNNGGTGNKMGMWNASPSADSGTAMYFLSTEEILDNLLSPAKELEPGEGVGYLTESAIATLNEKIEEVESAGTFKEKFDKAAALPDIIATLEIILPEEGKFYTIASACTGGREGKMIYVNTDGGMKFNTAGTDLGYLFQFEAAGDGQFYMYNVSKDRYLSTALAHGYGQEKAIAEETTGATKVAIKNLVRENVVGLYPEGGAMIHAQDANSVVVAWNNNDSHNGSAWRIVEVEDPTTTSFNLAIGEAGYSTLYLGCAVTVPEGVEAYIVNATNSTHAIMEKVDAIPAHTGVIITGAEGEAATAATYQFNYAASATAVEGNMLAGSTIDTYVAENAYVLSRQDGVVGLYKAALNVDATGAATGDKTHFKNNANKAYLVVPAAEGTEVASYSFRFGEGTTGIEEITDNREQSAVIYDLTGRRVEAVTAPGIYVVNGKKVLVK